MRQILKNGDLLLFHTRGFSPISLGIRLLTKSFWNHIGLFVDNNIIEALVRGVVATPIEKYIDNKNYILKAVTIKEEAFKDKEEYNKAIQTATSRMRLSIGQKYDYWAIVYLGIKYIIRGIWNKGAKYLPEKWNPFNSRYKFFCSELIASAFYNTSSISKYPNLFAGNKYQDVSTTTPRDIAKSPNIKHLFGLNKL